MHMLAQVAEELTEDYSKVAIYKFPEPNQSGRIDEDNFISPLPPINISMGVSQGFYWGVPKSVSSDDRFMKMQLHLADSMLKHIFVEIEYPSKFVKLVSDKILSTLPIYFMVSQESLMVQILEFLED